MKFLADESVDRQIVDHLRSDGHFVWYIAEMKRGISDDAVLDMANRKKALLLTADKDFGEIVFRQHRFTVGVVLIRLEGLSLTSKVKIVSSTVNKHRKELTHAFAVITAGGIRIRQWFA